MTPPLTKLGSSPSSSRPVMIMPVDVVLPCAPATDTRRWPAISQASACERCSTGSPRSSASWYSGLSCQSAPVTTTRVGVADVGGVVADRDLGAEVAQRRDVGRVAHVGAGDAVPGAEEQARDAAHARAADADEVHGAELGGDLGGEVGLDGHVRRFFLGASVCGRVLVRRMPRHPLTPRYAPCAVSPAPPPSAASTRATMRSVPSRWPTDAAAAAMRATRSRSPSSGHELAPHPVGQ